MTVFKWIVFVLVLPLALMAFGIWLITTISIYVELYQNIVLDQDVELGQTGVMHYILYFIWTIQMVKFFNNDKDTQER